MKSRTVKEIDYAGLKSMKQNYFGQFINCRCHAFCFFILASVIVHFSHLRSFNRVTQIVINAPCFSSLIPIRAANRRRKKVVNAAGENERDSRGC